MAGTNANQLILASDPLPHLVTDSDNTMIGYPLTFAKRFLRYLPPTDNIILLPCATTGIGFQEGTSGSGIGSTFYNQTITHINNAIANIPNAIPRCILHGIHGGNDVAMDNTVWQTALDNTLSGYRTGISRPNLPIGIFGYTPQAKIDSAARAAKEVIYLALRDRLPNVVAMTDQTNLTHNSGDTVHFNAASLRLIGSRLFDVIRPRLGLN